MQESPPELQSNLRMSLDLQQGDDHRRYNLSTVDEVAAIIPGTGEDVDYNRDIVLRYKPVVYTILSNREIEWS